MTLPELRTTLASALAAHLGRYKLPGGSTTPAIYVLDWGRYPAKGLPEDWAIDPTSSGLECVIDPTPSYLLTAPYGLNAVAQRTYEVRLRAWLDPLKLEPAFEALLAAVPLDAQGLLSTAPRSIPATSFSVAEIRCNVAV